MEYQKIISLLQNTPNLPSKFRTKSWARINDDLHRTYNTSSQCNFKITMLNSRLCDYGDTYLLVKEL